MKKNENGRSMIEMLGVLAIIGVLSVGGIYGYTTAMRKYKANEIAQTLSMLATMAHARNAGEGANLLLKDSGLGLSAGCVALANTTVATCVDSSGDAYGSSESGCALIKITVDSSDSNWDDIKKALCNIVPKSADNASTAGYFVDCSSSS